MPRTHGRIQATIWNDPEFIALEAGPQRLYMFLLSQPDLSHAGLVPMRVRRWAMKVRLGTPATITADLGDLENHRFIVTDKDTEEVLVRTFVRNDGVYKQPKVMMRMREDAHQIESPKLRSAFRSELDRLPLHELGDTTRVQVDAVVEGLREDFARGIAYPSAGVSDTPNWSRADEPGDESAENGQPAGQEANARVSGRVSDTPRVRAGTFPQPPSPFPQPPATLPPTAGRGQPSAEVALRDDPPTAQTLIAEWIDHCNGRPPGRVVGQVSKEIKTLLDEGVSYDRVRAAVAAWNSKGLHPSTLASVVHEITNAGPRVSRRQAETDDMFDRAWRRAVDAEAAS